MSKAWERPSWGQDSGRRYAQALMEVFYHYGNVNGLQSCMKPAYQATRDGVEAKVAHKEKVPTEPISSV